VRWKVLDAIGSEIKRVNVAGTLLCQNSLLSVVLLFPFELLHVIFPLSALGLIQSMEFIPIFLIGKSFPVLCLPSPLSVLFVPIIHGVFQLGCFQNFYDPMIFLFPATAAFRSRAALSFPIEP